MSIEITEPQLEVFSEFIAGTKIPENVCDGLIEYWESKPKTKGTTTLGDQRDLKESQDVTVWNNEDPRINEYLGCLQQALDLYKKKYRYIELTRHPWSINEPFNIQYYLPGGGYKAWHYERANGWGAVGRRHLVFMTYLNDVPGGGTDFLYQNLTLEAKKGMTVFWPADWTFTHRSQVAEVSEKWIVTGWYGFDDVKEGDNNG